MIKDIEKYIKSSNNCYFSNLGLVVKANGVINFNFNGTVKLYMKGLGGSDRELLVNGKVVQLPLNKSNWYDYIGDITVSRKMGAKGNLLIEDFSYEEEVKENIVMKEPWHNFVKKVKGTKGIKSTEFGVFAFDGAEISGAEVIETIETDPVNAFVRVGGNIKFTQPCRIIKIDCKGEPTYNTQFVAKNLEGLKMGNVESGVRVISPAQCLNSTNIEKLTDGILIASGGSFDVSLNVESNKSYKISFVLTKVSGNGRVCYRIDDAIIGGSGEFVCRSRGGENVTINVTFGNVSTGNVRFTVFMNPSTCSGKILIKNIIIIEDGKQYTQKQIKDISVNGCISDNISLQNSELSASIIITTYKRPHLLRWGLFSLARQQCSHKFEVIVVNDGIEDETESICNEFKDKLNIKYIFSGQRNSIEPQWRVPGFAYNIGVRQSVGEIIFLSCAEMFHMGNTIEEMINCLLLNPNKRVTMVGRDDINGGFLNAVNSTNGNPSINDVNSYCENLSSQLPFFMGMYRLNYYNIGGYDEDFTGIAWEDNDFIYRLEDFGIKQMQIQSIVVHLWHQRISLNSDKINKAWEFNRNLYNSRRGKVIRNQNREWGKI